MTRGIGRWSGARLRCLLALAILLFGVVWCVSWLAGRDRITVVVLDYRTLQVQQVWERDVPRCAPFLGASESQLADAAEGLLATYYSSASFDHLGQVSLLTLGNGDFFGLAMLASCDAQPIYAGTIVWAGRGSQVYPSVSDASDSLDLRVAGIGQPAGYISLADPWMRLSVESPKADEVWAVASRVEALATTRSGDVRVLVSLYPESVGPNAEATTHYIVFVMPR